MRGLMAVLTIAYPSLPGSRGGRRRCLVDISGFSPFLLVSSLYLGGMPMRCLMPCSRLRALVLSGFLFSRLASRFADIRLGRRALLTSRSFVGTDPFR